MGHMIENKTETVTKISEFAGKPFLAIYTVKNGKESERPLISFGLAKAKAILSALEDIKKFVGNK